MSQQDQDQCPKFSNDDEMLGNVSLTLTTMLTDIWGEVKFSDVISSVTNGIGGKQSKDGIGIPVTRIETIADQTINYEKVGFIADYDNSKIDKYLLNQGDILFSHINSPLHLGKTAIFREQGTLYHGINLLRIVINSNLMVPEFFNYFCKLLRFQGEFSIRAQHAVNQSSLNQKKLGEFDISLPSLAEQQQIAAKLDELLAQVDTLKTRLDTIPKILKRFRQSVLASAVSGKLTENWRNSDELIGWKRNLLGDLVKKPNYGTSSKSQKEGKIPVLRMGNLQDGKLDWSDLVYTSDEEEIRKYRLHNGDVLFNRTNSPELVGKTSIYRGERESIYAGYLIRIQCTDQLNPEFLNIHLNSPSAREYCRAVKSDGVSQSNINAQKVVAYPIYYPPVPEQTEIVNRVEQLFTYADQIEQRVKNAQARVNHLSQAILAKAFRGELTADWREQNPDLISGENSAEALLARIQTEQGARPLKKAKKQL